MKKGKKIMREIEVSEYYCDYCKNKLESLLYELTYTPYYDEERYYHFCSGFCLYHWLPNNFRIEPQIHAPNKVGGTDEPSEGSGLGLQKAEEGES